MSASSFCTSRDTFFCLVDSMGRFVLRCKVNKKNGATAQWHNGVKGI